MSKDYTFKLTAETMINAWGVKLFRMEATVDIKSRNVKKGDKGGWLESKDVNGNARVSGDAWVYGNAWVSGNAQVYGNAQVSGDAWVYGNARVSGGAQVYGNARVSGDAQVYGNAWVYGNAQVSGDAQVSGNAQVSGKKAYVKGWFIGGDDTGKITNITDRMGTDYWEAQYVLGDYEINDIDPPQDKPETINIGGTSYEVTDDLKNALKDLKEAND